MNRTFARHVAFASLLIVLSIAVVGCGGQPAAPAPSADAAPPAAQGVAMADAPQRITPQQFEEEFAANGAPYQLIDVRTPEEFASGHIAGSVNIPVESIGSRLGEISKESPVVLYCRSGRRSAQAATILDDAGYDGLYDLGGIQAWQAAGLPVEQ